MNTIQTQWKFQGKSEHFKEIKILLNSETWDKMYKCLTIVTKCELETLVKGGAILLSQSWRLGEELSMLCFGHSASHLTTVFWWPAVLLTPPELLYWEQVEEQSDLFVTIWKVKIITKQLISEKNQHSKEVSWCFGPFFIGWFSNKIAEKTASRRRLSCAHSLTVWFILRTESWWEASGQWAERED